jgi:hypothetical protein
MVSTVIASIKRVNSCCSRLLSKCFLSIVANIGLAAE